MVGLIVVGSTISLILSIRWIIRFLRKHEFRDWEIDDEIKTITGETYLISGWNKKFIVVITDDGIHRMMKWIDFSENLSAKRRRYYELCKKDMKMAPAFEPHQHMNNVTKRVKKQTTSSSYNDGKDISLWSEIECQTYLKIALESEDYEFAEKIKKQMEKYR